MEGAGMANNFFYLNSFNSPQELIESLAKRIVTNLADAIKQKGVATLALSGGSTPIKLFDYLSTTDLDWSSVKITLVDERWVETSSDLSNEKLVREHLLVNNASKATFLGLKSEFATAKESVDSLNATLQEFSPTLDVVVLGMGLDGHTASFFSTSPEFQVALTTEKMVCATTAPTEPKERITLSRDYLLSTKNLLLHIEGEKKRELFLKTFRSNNEQEIPLIALMRQNEPLLEAYYAD
jgi:6-phosphogluconolactonase